LGRVLEIQQFIAEPQAKEIESEEMKA